MQSDEKIATLLSTLSDKELNELNAAAKQAKHKSELENLKKLIEMEIKLSRDFVSAVNSDASLKEYHAGQPEKVFQNWIEKNLWVFGGEYYKKHDARKISINSESDLIIENPEGFIDLIELKRPSAPLLKENASHSCHYPSPELAKVLGQGLHYLKKLD